MDFSEFEKKIAGLILDTPSPGKHAARSAIRHIQKAFELENFDKEMAAFRAITGEEEAATAIFHAFKQRKYPGADKLDPYSHNHKAAAYPFLIVFSQGIDEAVKATGLEFVAELVKKDGKERFRLRLDFPDGKSGRITPPLELTLKSNGDLYDFSRQTQQLVSDKNAKTIIDLVEKRANLRNTILYGSASGIPHVENLGKLLINSRMRIFHLLEAYLFIAPFPIQIGAKQCLYSFLKMLKLISPEIKFL